MKFSFAQVGHVTCEVLRLSSAKAPAVRARIKHLQRLQFPSSVNVGGGARSNYDVEALLQVVLAFEMFDLGFTPDRVKPTVQTHWNQLRWEFAVALASPAIANYVATFPSALDGLRIPEETAEVATLYSGSLEQLAQTLAGFHGARSSANFAAINITALVLEAADAVGALEVERGTGMAASPKEAFMNIVRGWRFEGSR